jgi:hypothetical protein
MNYYYDDIMFAATSSGIWVAVLLWLLVTSISANDNDVILKQMYSQINEIRGILENTDDDYSSVTTESPEDPEDVLMEHFDIGSANLYIMLDNRHENHKYSLIIRGCQYVTECNAIETAFKSKDNLVYIVYSDNERSFTLKIGVCEDDDEFVKLEEFIKRCK